MQRAELLILVIGIGLRVVRFALPRPLWLDEALIALNLLARHPASFFRALEGNQVSPPGFLLGERLVTALVGAGERTLRLLPLIAGIIALILFARLARRILDPGMALLATALAALSPLLIYYSAEVKSYGFDWLAAIVLMHATLTLIEDPTRQAWIRWAAAAMFGAFVSTPAPFFVGGCALALLVAPGVRRSPRALLHVVVAGAPAALIAGSYLLMASRGPGTLSFMQSYWAGAFLEPDFSSGVLLGAKLTRDFMISALFGDLAMESPARRAMYLVVAVSVAGAMASGRRSLPAAVMLLAPAVFTGLASLGGWWPLTPRLLLFVVPAAVITLAAGVDAVARLAPRTVRTPVLYMLSAAIVAMALPGLPGAMRAQRWFLGVPEAMREAGSRLGPDAVVYLASDIVPATFYYLRFHPDRLELGGDSIPRSSTLRGRRLILGAWPPNFVGAGAGVQPRAPDTPAPEWLALEGRRVLEAQASEIWMLMGVSQARTALPSWLEAAGLTREAEYATSGVRILKYRRK